MRFFRTLIAPFVIVKREKLYIGWVFYTLIFGLINLIADLLMGNFDNVEEYIKTGQFYTFSIALVSPFIIEILLGILVEWRLTKKAHFLRYKIPCVLISVVLMIVITFLWIGNYKSNIVIQFVCTLVSLLI